MPTASKKDATLASSNHTTPAPDIRSRPAPEKTVTVLAVSPYEEDHVLLRHIFSHSNWHILGARSGGEASAILRAAAIPVILCESELPDSTWIEVLRETERLSVPPLLIVTSRVADDHLWAEVINLGGYDVLMKPFDPLEVVRVISLAWLHWREGREQAGREAEPQAALVGGA